MPINKVGEPQICINCISEDNIYTHTTRVSKKNWYKCNVCRATWNDQDD